MFCQTKSPFAVDLHELRSEQNPAVSIPSPLLIYEQNHRIKELIQGKNTIHDLRKPGKKDMSWGAVSNDEGLIVYQKALQFVMTLYGICAGLPPSEEEHLTRLLKKAAVGVTTHISGSGRKQTNTEKARSLQTAMGYLEECEYYLDHAEQQGYINAAAEKTELKAVRDLLDSYLESLGEA